MHAYDPVKNRGNIFRTVRPTVRMTPMVVVMRDERGLRSVPSTNFVMVSKLAAVKQASKIRPSARETESPSSSPATTASRIAWQAVWILLKFQGRRATACPKAVSACSRSALFLVEAPAAAPDWNKP